MSQQVLFCYRFTYTSNSLLKYKTGLGGSIMVNHWTINPEVRGLIPGLARTFVRDTS